MAGQNYLIILKEIERGYSNNSKPISAICRLERTDGVYSLDLTFVNLLSLNSGEYFFYLLDSNETLFKFPLGVRPTTKHLILPSSPNLEKGFVATLSVNKNGVPLCLAFSLTENCPLTFYQLKSIIAQNALKDIKEQPKPLTFDSQNAKTNTLSPTDALPIYDDEAVATVNYFDAENLREFNKEKDNSNANGYFQSQNGVFDIADTQKTQENEDDPLRYTIKTQSDFSQKYSEQNVFYNTERERIEKMLNSFPDYDLLKCYFPDSRFVKINYSVDKYYVVGVIKENGNEKYICYGVPATYSSTPPKQLDGYCVFIPLSIFDMKGEGFWMMFQDCVTGKNVFPKTP